MKVNKTKMILENSAGMGRGSVAWTGGKDSTLILYLIREVFGTIPWRVFFNDTGDLFDEQVEFIDWLKREWDFSVITVGEPDKIKAIETFIDYYNPQFIVTGIRRDEHEARSQETYYSRRRDHIRVHPILDWTEKDVWDYTKENSIPYCSLYDQGYRSLGEKSKTKKSTTTERSGRELTKEETMKELRKAGYY